MWACRIWRIWPQSLANGEDDWLRGVYCITDLGLAGRRFGQPARSGADGRIDSRAVE